MTGIHFADINMFYLLWAIPLFVLIFLYGNYKRTRSLRVFAETDALRRINVNVDPAGRMS